MKKSIRSGCSCARMAVASILVWASCIFLNTAPAPASGEFSPSSLARGALLVASPSLDDPNFHQTVILIVEHGPGGTLGLVLNRATRVLLSDALPDMTVLKGTNHRLFAGGPVERTRLLMLFRLREATGEAQSVFDGVYVGGSPEILERVITKATPTETFRAFAGYAGWGPMQLESEILEGAWAVLPPDPAGMLDKDPATLWPDCVSQIKAPRVISN